MLSALFDWYRRRRDDSERRELELLRDHGTMAEQAWACELLAELDHKKEARRSGPKGGVS